MRVVIIAPPYPLEEAPSPPLGVCYVAAAFEAAGAEVRIFDYIVSQYEPDKLRRELDAFDPDVVGATSVTMTFPAAAAILSKAKELRPDIVTVMGGPHVSFDVDNTLLSYPQIDLLVLGEGEDTIAELVPAITDRAGWPAIRGLAFVENGRVIRTEPRAFIRDLDRLPLPARHLLQCSRYQALGFPVSIITGRGCPYPCIFCLGRRMVGQKVRYRDPVKIVDEIESILDYGFNRINVADDLFLSNKDRARAVCREIMDRGIEIPWSAFARVNTVDLETLKIMRKAGCDSVSFGIESGNPEMLKRIKKKITLDQARNAVAWCKEAGILAHASFMVGLPGETRATLDETEDFAQSLDIIYGYHFLAPFPGTTVRESIDAYDLTIETSDWSCYDANRAIVRTSNLTPRDMEEWFSVFDRRNTEHMNDLERQYRDKTISQDDFLQVYGRHRMELTFRILSEDIIEKECRFPVDSADGGNGGAEELLVSRVADCTGADAGLVGETLRDFVNKGHIKPVRENGFLCWYWTHNRFVDQLPGTPQGGA